MTNEDKKNKEFFAEMNNLRNKSNKKKFSKDEHWEMFKKAYKKIFGKIPTQEK